MSSNNLVQSLGRGLDILRVLAEARSGLAMSLLMERTGLKRPTLHNLLRTLESREFVIRHRGRYTMGPALYALATLASANTVQQSAERGVSYLADRLPKGIISYCEAVDGEALVRLQHHPEQKGMPSRPNQLFQPYGTASGLAVLAFCDPETYARMRQRHPFAIEAAHHWQSEAALDAFLAEARACGHVIPPFCAERTYKLAAWPVFAADNALVGVLGVAWYTATPVLRRTERKMILDALRQAAQFVKQQGDQR